MYINPILSPSGKPVFSVGGRQAWKTFSYRGFCVSLEWVISERSKSAAPILAIWKQPFQVYAKSSDGSDNGIWCIDRRSITNFVGFTTEGKCTGGPSTYCMRECQRSLPILGFDRNDVNAFKALVDCVVKFADELVRMPVTPQWLQKRDSPRAMWDVKTVHKASGKTITEGEA